MEEIHIQSYTDIITNSSSTVYISTADPEDVKKIVDNILKCAGSDKTCDDIFEIADHSDYYKFIAKDEQYSVLANNISILFDPSNLYFLEGGYDG